MKDDIPPSKIPCEVYSRIVGYVSPRRNWNRGKLQEARDRKYYVLKEEVNGQGKSESGEPKSNSG